MSFDVFQTATATMQKLSVDGSGDGSVSSSFTVKVDPVLGRKRIFSDDQEEIAGFETVISPNDSIDLTHDRWNLVYNGRTYKVEGIEPFYKIGTDIIEHYEVSLR